MSSRFDLLPVLMFSMAIGGCSDSTPPTAETSMAVATPAVFNPAGAPTVEFSVPDMMCPEGCAVEVKEILAKQAGAKDVLVDFEAKMAIVAVDKDVFDAEQALAALVDKQFTNSALKDAAAAKPQAAEGAAVQ